MAEIIQDEKGGKKGRPKKHSTHIDMTPMVDLMCLLITFFMLTTAFSKAKVMTLILPDKKKDNKNAPQVAASRTLNLILSADDKIYYYPGKADKPPYPPLQVTDFSAEGIRKILITRNKTLSNIVSQFKEDLKTGKIKLPYDSIEPTIKKMRSTDDTGPVVLIKSDDKAKYRNLVDIIDEMTIANIAKYAIVDMTPIEKIMLGEATKGAPQAK